MNWLLLRGLSRQACHWGSFTSKLETHSSRDVLALDLPGFGTASEHKSPLAMREIVEFLRPQFLNAPSHQKPWSLLGLSFGGMVALEWLRLYPNDFRTCVVINSSLAGICSINERITNYGKLVLLKCLLLAPPIKKERLILTLTSSKHLADADLLASWEAIERHHPTRNLEVLKQLLISSQYRGPQKITTPLLVLSSQKDQLVNPNCSARIAQKFGAAHFVHPESGHDLPLDAPEWVIEKISYFASSHVP